MNEARKKLTHSFAALCRARAFPGLMGLSVWFGVKFQDRPLAVKFQDCPLIPGSARTLHKAAKEGFIFLPASFTDLVGNEACRLPMGS